MAAAVMAAAVLLSGCTVLSPSSDSAGGTEWDAGNIISDAVFYNSAAFSNVIEVQAAIDKVAPGCVTSGCLGRAQYSPGTLDNPYCSAWSGPTGQQPFASILYYLGKACGVNPQVAIVMIMKESQGFNRPIPPAALTGFGCPDTGPGGSANCDSSRSGVWNQTAGMFASMARGRQDASWINYIEGQTHNILWNVAESGCGSAPVLVKNRATAWLYTYTPYQPNQAALDAYPGTGDACSAYGNRNFFRMFQTWFGPTGGGKPVAGQGGVNIANGVQVTLPNNQFVAEAVRGKTITAPSEAMAKGLAAGFDKLGMPYVWGGTGNDGCPRGGGALNSCQGLVGYDCSGFTAFVLEQAGFQIPGDSSSQRASGVSVPVAQALPGDLLGWSGHIAVSLGSIDGTPYMMEFSTVGQPGHIVATRMSGIDSSAHRYWSGSASA